MKKLLGFLTLLLFVSALLLLIGGFSTQGYLFLGISVVCFVVYKLKPNPKTQKTYICSNPNCGYSGHFKSEPKGSTAVGLILCLFFLLPGIIYFIFKSGSILSCPKCNLPIR